MSESETILTHREYESCMACSEIVPQSASTLQIYLPIQKTDTVFSTILHNLYKDEEFLQNITRLENGTDREKKNALIIKKTVSKLRVYGDAKQPLLLARDVGILMGISNIKLQLKYYNSAEKVIGLYQLNNGKTSQVEFLTWKGFIRAASNSRSILSDLFREFIYELVAEAIGDHSLLDKITKRVVEKNPELINSALTELDKNAEHYRLLYEREYNQRRLLEEGLDHETQLRLIAEQRQTDAELTAIIQEHKAKQMEKYIHHYEQSLINLYDTPSTVAAELQLLRKKYLKPIYIYAPHASLYNEWVSKKDLTIADFSQYIPEYPDRIEYFIKRSAELAASKSCQDTSIAKNYIFPENDYFYFYLHYGQLQFTRTANSCEEYIHIATEWVIDRRHFDSVIDELCKECEKITFRKKIVYYSTLDEIKLIISQQLLGSESN